MILFLLFTAPALAGCEEKTELTLTFVNMGEFMVNSIKLVPQNSAANESAWIPVLEVEDPSIESRAKRVLTANVPQKALIGQWQVEVWGQAESIEKGFGNVTPLGPLADANGKRAELIGIFFNDDMDDPRIEAQSYLGPPPAAGAGIAMDDGYTRREGDEVTALFFKQDKRLLVNDWVRDTRFGAYCVRGGEVIVAEGFWRDRLTIVDASALKGSDGGLYVYGVADENIAGASAVNGASKPAAPTPAPGAPAGWYHRQSGAEESVASLDLFKLDMESETATFYTAYGEELMIGEAADNGDGSITVSLDFFGDVLMYIDDERHTLTLEDGSVFAFGPEISAEEIRGGYEGKWYMNGELDAEFYTFNRDGTCAQTMVYGGTAFEGSAGTWSLRDVTNLDEHGREKYLSIECDDGLMGSDFAVSESGIALIFRDFGDYKCYIREDCAGTGDAERELALFALYGASSWFSPNGLDDGADAYLCFYDDFDAVLKTVPAGGGSFTNVKSGEWAYLGGSAYEIAWDDGAQETLTMREDGSSFSLQDGTEYGR